MFSRFTTTYERKFHLRPQALRARGQRGHPGLRPGGVAATNASRHACQRADRNALTNCLSILVPRKLLRICMMRTRTSSWNVVNYISVGTCPYTILWCCLSLFFLRSSPHLYLLSLDIFATIIVQYQWRRSSWRNIGLKIHCPLSLFCYSVILSKYKIQHTEHWIVAET